MAYLFSNHSFSPPTVDNEPAYFNAEEQYDSWKYKVIDYWSSHDTLFWLLSELCKLQVQNPATLKLEQFVHTRGCDLKRFSKEDFRRIIPQYGDLLYHQLQIKLRNVGGDVSCGETVAYNKLPNNFVAPEHFNMSYFDQPMPHPGPSCSTSRLSEPKQWPTDRREYECWAYKRLLEWLPQDTLDCLVHTLLQMNISPAKVRLDRVCQVYGCDLAKMTLEDYRWMVPEYGDLLYMQLQPKIKAALESGLPWCGTYESPVFPQQNRPLSYAHRQQLSYAHPRTSTDDAVLNLSRERASTSAGVLSREGIPVARTSTQTSGHSLSLFDQCTSLSSSQSSTVARTSTEKNGHSLSLFDQSTSLSSSQNSTSKSNFSILSMPTGGADCTSASTEIKKEQEPNPPLKIIIPDSPKKSTEDLCSPSSHMKDSDSHDSCSVDTVIKNEDSQRDSLTSTGDSVHAKGPSLENSVLDHGYDSDSNDEMQIDQEKERPTKEKRRPGRPRSLHKKDKSKGKVGRVWEFIRDLIMDPKYNPSVISWEDREKGLFRFRSGDQVAKLWGRKRGNPRMNFENFSRSIRSATLKYNPYKVFLISWEDREKGLFRFRSGDQLAKLWGRKRGNPRMNFENFSRSIRQNYKKGYLLPVEKIRLVYQFGPRSTGWRAGDPPTLPVSLPPATSTTTPTPATNN